MTHDSYSSFRQLQVAEPAGSFRVIVRDRGSSVLVMAIHGGAIEPGTSEVARALVAHDLNLYLFEGLKSSSNSTLHITSHKFDEPRALELVARSDTILTVHGCMGTELATYIGGADVAALATIEKALHASGFTAARHGNPSLMGWDPSNICNRGRRRGGIQLEITRAQREALREGEKLHKFTTSVRQALSSG